MKGGDISEFYCCSGTGNDAEALDAVDWPRPFALARLYCADERYLETDPEPVVRRGVHKNWLAGERPDAPRLPPAWLHRLVHHSTDGGAGRGPAHRLPRRCHRHLCPHWRAISGSGPAVNKCDCVGGNLPARRAPSIAAPAPQ